MDFVIVLCFVVRYFVSILVLQSSRCGRERELVALICLFSWCLVIFVWLFLTMPPVCLQFVIVFFPSYSLTIFENVCNGVQEKKH